MRGLPCFTGRSGARQLQNSTPRRTTPAPGTLLHRRHSIKQPGRCRKRHARSRCTKAAAEAAWANRQVQVLHATTREQLHALSAAHAQEVAALQMQMGEAEAAAAAVACSAATRDRARSPSRHCREEAHAALVAARAAAAVADDQAAAAAGAWRWECQLLTRQVHAANAERDAAAARLLKLAALVRQRLPTLTAARAAPAQEEAAQGARQEELARQRGSRDAQQAQLKALAEVQQRQLVEFVQKYQRLAARYARLKSKVKARGASGRESRRAGQPEAAAAAGGEAVAPVAPVQVAQQKQEEMPAPPVVLQLAAQFAGDEGRARPGSAPPSTLLPVTGGTEAAVPAAVRLLASHFTGAEGAARPQTAAPSSLKAPAERMRPATAAPRVGGDSADAASLRHGASLRQGSAPASCELRIGRDAGQARALGGRAAAPAAAPAVPNEAEDPAASTAPVDDGSAATPSGVLATLMSQLTDGGSDEEEEDEA